MKRRKIVVFVLAILSVVMLAFAGACSGNGGNTHSWATEWSSDGTKHWHACTNKGCEEITDEAECAGGTATCTKKAVCATCKGEYGELDAANHASEEIEYVSNGNGTHKTSHKCCGVIISESETCTGGEATCNAKAKCEHCGAEYGETTEHAYAAGIDATDSVYDYRKCECGAIDREHGFKKTVDTDNQKLLMTDATVSLNLTGVSEYASVKSVALIGTEENVDLGSSVTAIDFGAIKTDEQAHGERKITVIVTDNDGFDHEISLNVILITKTIETEDDLKELLYFGKDEADRYGYYVLENDIVYTGKQNKVKFRGTFDGNGKTISTTNMNNGLFSYTLGCTIKNLTVKATFNAEEYEYYTILSNGSSWAKFIDVTVIYEGGADSTAIIGGGFLFGKTGCTHVTFERLVVNAAGKKIGALCGASIDDGTTFTDCVVYADEIACLASNKDQSNKVAFEGRAGIEQRIVDVKEIELWKDSVSLDYGNLFDGKNAVSITCGEYSLGTSFDNITVPNEIKDNKQAHGYTTICIGFEDGSCFYTTVILVTAEIKTEEEFKAAAMITSVDEQTKFGYYKLANDIVFTSHVRGGQALGNSVLFNAEADKAIGFRGTIDGQNKYTISTAAGVFVCNGGFFGLLGDGAVIKNVKFSVAIYSGEVFGLLAAQGHGATIQNVEITLTAASGCTYAGVLFGRFSGTTTSKNVTINAAGLDLQAIFGNSTGNNMPKCEGVTVKAKSIACIYKTTYGDGLTTSLEGFEFIETL